MPLPIEKSPGEIYSHDILIKIFQFIRDKLFTEWNTYPAYHFYAGGFWCRISVQVWTEVRYTDLSFHRHLILMFYI